MSYFRSTYDSGSYASFRINMRNGRDEEMRTGGDEIRVWLTHLDTGRRIAAQVFDLGDGSYLTSVFLPWPGIYQ